MNAAEQRSRERSEDGDLPELPGMTCVDNRAHSMTCADRRGWCLRQRPLRSDKVDDLPLVVGWTMCN